MPSTVIAEFQYDTQRRTLTVRFRPSGKCYRYFDAPEWVYVEMKRAFSKGSYFNLHVRDVYRFEDVTVAQAEGPFLRP